VVIRKVEVCHEAYELLTKGDGPDALLGKTRYVGSRREGSVELGNDDVGINRKYVYDLRPSLKGRTDHTRPLMVVA
jgi:hypothetical protein